MNKHARHFAIKDIISSLGIASQEQLRRELRKRGYAATQATLSRDLKELGVSRNAARGGLRYALQPEAEVQILKPLVEAEVISIHANETLIVLKTLPGCASTVGEFIDVQSHPAILGTLAGDNTLLVIPASTRRLNEVIQFLKRKLIEGQ